VLYYSGHILAAYANTAVIEVYKVNGPLAQSLNLQEVCPDFKLLSITNIMIPKLDWQDREFDT